MTPSNATPRRSSCSRPDVARDRNDRIPSVGPSTQAVHGGEPRTKEANALATPIIQSATFTFANSREIADHFEGRIEREEYGRYGNPTQSVAERKLAALEGAEA